MNFTRALVRPPAASFAGGITTASLGAPDVALALRQHAAYCAALRKCGVTVYELPAEPRFPDSTFVEDTAVLAGALAVVTRPGAESRRGETAGMSERLGAFFARVEALVAPATLDGGDVMRDGDHFFIGLSERTNEEGASALARLLRPEGFRVTTVDIRGSGLLHLKSGITPLGEGAFAATRGVAVMEAFRELDLITVDDDERYAANLVRVNDSVFVAAGFPRLAAELRRRRYAVVELEMSEFEKMDGGLSCLSLRF